MKKLLWVALLVPGVVWAGGFVGTTQQWAELQASFPDVTKEQVNEAHDRFPGHGRQFGHRRDSGENECAEPPDGDNNCDDPRGVPEPGALGLAGIGFAGLGWVWLRRRK